MIDILNSYRILIPGSDATPRVEAIIAALESQSRYVTRWEDGRAQIDCPDEAWQKKWMRRLRSAERDDLLDNAETDKEAGRG